MSHTIARTILAGLMLAAPWAPLTAAGQDAPAESADPAPPTADELRASVRQLGSESFVEREQAESTLRDAGLASHEALEVGLTSNDLQIRRTCRRLLNDILELDYHRRLERFLADDAGRLEHDLPGWRRFRALAGDEPQARELFGEMHQEEGPLLISAEAGSEALVDALELRLRSLYQAMRQRAPQQRVQPSAGAVTALLFVAADPEVEIPQTLHDSNYWLQIVNTPQFSATLTKSDANTIPRKILGSWLLLPSSPPLLHQKLRLGMRYELPESRTLALDTLEQGDKGPAAYTCYAIDSLSKLSDDPAATAALIAPLLNDERVISRSIVNKVPIEIQVRDVVLGWLVHLTGQEHAAYGLPKAKTVFDRLKTRPRTYSVSYSFMRFDKTEDRTAALKRWKEWVAKHPLPEPKPDDEKER